MFKRFVMEGVALHAGCAAKVRVEPGRPGSGVVFEVEGGEIPARPESIWARSARATVLESADRTVGTVEHLLAALLAYGQTDVRIAVDGPEVPILDGSALPWSLALEEAGAAPGFSFVKIADEVSVELDGSSARIEPLGQDREPSIRVDLDFGREELGRQQMVFCPLVHDFSREIAPARTFAFEADVEEILAAGLARGASLDSALIIGKHGPLNPEGQRFEDEPVRHKVLDALGDLSLLGGLPWAEVRLVKPGHRLLHRLVRSAWRLCSPPRECLARGAR